MLPFCEGASLPVNQRNKKLPHNFLVTAFFFQNFIPLFYSHLRCVFNFFLSLFLSFFHSFILLFLPFHCQIPIWDLLLLQTTMQDLQVQHLFMFVHLVHILKIQFCFSNLFLYAHYIYLCNHCKLNKEHL